MQISSNNYRHSTTNNFEKLLTKEDNKNIVIIMASILINIYMYIRPNRFLENNMSEIVYGTDGKILKELFIVFWRDW